jgi:hypothetical protein
MKFHVKLMLPTYWFFLKVIHVCYNCSFYYTTTSISSRAASLVPAPATHGSFCLQTNIRHVWCLDIVLCMATCRFCFSKRLKMYFLCVWCQWVVFYLGRLRRLSFFMVYEVFRIQMDLIPVLHEKKFEYVAFCLSIRNTSTNHGPDWKF